MSTVAAQKKLGELEGDSPELIAWGLLEWIRRVDNLGDRDAILNAFSESLGVAHEGASAHSAGHNQPATGPQRRLAYRLAQLIAETEGRDIGQRNQGDRTWVLQTFTECLLAVMGKRQAVAVAVDVAA